MTFVNCCQIFLCYLQNKTNKITLYLEGSVPFKHTFTSSTKGI